MAASLYTIIIIIIIKATAFEVDYTAREGEFVHASSNNINCLYVFGGISAVVLKKHHI